MNLSHLSSGDIWLTLSLIMIPLELLTKTTFVIGLGIALGYTGVISLISFGILNLHDQFMLFFGLLTVIQTGAFFLYRQRLRGAGFNSKT